MNPKLSQSLIPLERVQALVQLEAALVVVGLALGSWLVYKLLLRDTSPERHRNLTQQFRNLGYHLLFGTIYAAAYWGVSQIADTNPALLRLTSYLGLITLVQGALIFVKVSRILVFEYLFLSHMKVAVPLLLVNLCTLLLTVFLAGWLITDIFNVRLAPLLATSAIFSVVLGLALQDTLGNLFAGVALQIDKPYEIGDWIEIQNPGQRWLGQVQEISWRATVLYGIGDESITVPNRVMAQSHITNYAARVRPIFRSQVFRLPFDVSIAKAKEIMLQAARSVPGVSKDRTLILAAETTESWISFKVIYSLTDFGAQLVIADKVVTAVVEALHQNGIKLATQKVEIQNA
ncbi:MAG: mechanosensitive ion channel family protein [Oligoflexia bacterium]|nr:mechanosensitive ion channel family protein [Oligoflexia bacterium]